MKKNLDVIIFAIIAIAVVAWATVTFVNENTNIAEIETVSDSGKSEKEETDQKSEENIVEEISDFNPHYTKNTNPEKFGLKTQIYSGSTQTNSYSSPDFDFGYNNNYSSLKGVFAFRGNNFRDSAVYGKAELKDKKFDADSWQVTTGSLASGSGHNAWSGSGWTGQPLIVSWDKETRSHMNMKEDKKQKENLTEVIYATMAGKIYFIDLEDGEYTREPMNLGFTFKGAGSLDPRGYPIMYVGAGDSNPSGERPKMFIINLLDCTVIKEYSGVDSIAHRTWCAFDSSAIVSEKTDTLIYPGENGLIYSIKLNSSFDKKSGELKVNPDEPVKFKVTTSRSNDANYWYGFETSPVVFGKYMYIADNGGYLYCIDMTNFNVIWMQDVVDDTNCSPVLEIEDGKAYIYISTSLHWTRQNFRGDIPVFKINAENGEIVWKHEFNCATVDGTSGGVQGTMCLGKNDCDDLVFVPVAHYPSTYQGGIKALSKKTGEEVWYYKGDGYTWSSPVLVQGADKKSVLINGDTNGYLVMLDAKTGKVLDKIKAGGLIEASPAVYDDTLVIGFRDQLIKGIKLK